MFKYWPNVLVVLSLMLLSAVLTHCGLDFINTPTPPPSELTQSILTSLESGDGWEKTAACNYGEILHRPTGIRIGWSQPCFYVCADGRDLGWFTWADRDRIYQAYLGARYHVADRQRLETLRLLQGETKPMTATSARAK